MADGQNNLKCFIHEKEPHIWQIQNIEFLHWIHCAMLRPKSKNRVCTTYNSNNKTERICVTSSLFGWPAVRGAGTSVVTELYHKQIILVGIYGVFRLVTLWSAPHIVFEHFFAYPTRFSVLPIQIRFNVYITVFAQNDGIPSLIFGWTGSTYIPKMTIFDEKINQIEDTFEVNLEYKFQY